MGKGTPVEHWRRRARRGIPKQARSEWRAVPCYRCRRWQSLVDAFPPVVGRSHRSINMTGSRLWPCGSRKDCAPVSGIPSPQPSVCRWPQHFLQRFLYGRRFGKAINESGSTIRLGLQENRLEPPENDTKAGWWQMVEQPFFAVYRQITHPRGRDAAQPNADELCRRTK
jgi:hypothetical protein